MADGVRIERRGALLVIRFDRPEKKNALTAAVYDAVAGALRAADGDDGIGVCLFLGHPGVFTAGNDIGEFRDMARRGRGLGDSVLGLLRAVASADRPLVAGVDGLAIGLGTTLLFHCDHVVASDRSLFRTPFVDLALVPEAASSLLAPRLKGHARAFELLVMGRALDAARAREAGLVNAVCAPEAVEAAAFAAATDLAAKPRQAMLAARRLLKGDPAAILARIDAEAEVFADRLVSPEAGAAFDAFLSRSKA